MSDTETILPSESTKIFLTDGGLETTLIFLEGFDLPCFASFDLLKDEKGYAALKNYYVKYLNIAKENGLGFVLESPTWRANPDWLEKVGLPRSATTEINQRAAQMMIDLKNEFSADVNPIVTSGCIGPRGDGYQPDTNMSPNEACAYHSEQIGALSGAGVDMVSAITMTNVEEAIGITQAAGEIGIPAVISFTVETDGNLPSGASLKDAIETVDSAVEAPPAYYMINCAHPVHFGGTLTANNEEPWIQRIKGLRSNASRKSHAELDESTELDRGDLEEFATEHKRLAEVFPHLKVFGGCCGTDDEHILEIATRL